MTMRVLLSLVPLLAACGSDGHDKPAVCYGEVEPGSLDLFEPCNVASDCRFVTMDQLGQQVLAGGCFDGFCAEPCVMSDDCIPFGLDVLQPGDPVGVGCGVGGSCGYLCQYDADCPYIGTALACTDGTCKFYEGVCEDSPPLE